MSEDELMAGITEALTLAGWVWYHVGRSDRVSRGTGAVGFPDIVAVHPWRNHLILWELKTETGRLTVGQWAWIGPLAVTATVIGSPMLDARVIRPADYDAALEYIVGKRDRMPAQ